MVLVFTSLLHYVHVHTIDSNSGMCVCASIQYWLMVHWSTEVSQHKFSQGSRVSFLDCSVLCLYLSCEAPSTCCYHGDSSSWVSCLQGSEEDFSVGDSRILSDQQRTHTSKDYILMRSLVCNFYLCAFC